MNSINSQVNTLISQGIEEIKGYLKTHGDITDLVDRDIWWTAVCFDNDGEAGSDMYDRIYVDTDGKLTTDLQDGFTIYEDELTPNHVLDILSIIEEINENN